MSIDGEIFRLEQAARTAEHVALWGHSSRKWVTVWNSRSTCIYAFFTCCALWLSVSISRADWLVSKRSDWWTSIRDWRRNHKHLFVDCGDANIMSYTYLYTTICLHIKITVNTQKVKSRWGKPMVFKIKNRFLVFMVLRFLAKIPGKLDYTKCPYSSKIRECKFM